MPSIAPFPRHFLCEHTPSKSRVFAVLSSPGRPDTLKAVLACTSPLLAQRAASALTSLALTGGGPMIDADADAIRAALPSAPAASFCEACQRLRDRAWPEADASPVNRDQVLVPDEDDLTPTLRDKEARTPSEARLGQLTGRVFRVIQFHEYHVHDADRLLAAAAANGWSPLSDDDDEDGQADPDGDLLGAVMHMADLGHRVPGADIICQESSGEMLDAAKGAELADRQREPVTAKFGGGWRLREQHGDRELAELNFAALFPVRSCDLDHADESEQDDCEVCGGWQLTPRTADLLYTALENLSDEAYDDVEECGEEPVSGKNADDWCFFDRLPRITWGMDAEWRRQVARACEDLARDLAAGDWPTPRNNAEEMALHLAIRDAPGYLEMWQDAADERHDALPRHHDDYDWDMCSEILFQDHDVLMLYDERLDGIEDPGNGLNQEAGVGDLRPSAWFKFFNNVEPRDPSRGFRR
jgi:hypothetical protein